MELDGKGIRTDSEEKGKRKEYNRKRTEGSRESISYVFCPTSASLLPKPQHLL